MSLIERSPQEFEAEIAFEAYLLPSVIMMPEAFAMEGVVTKNGINTITGYNIEDMPPLGPDERGIEVRLRDLEEFAQSEFPVIGEPEPAEVHRASTSKLIKGMLSKAGISLNFDSVDSESRDLLEK